MTILGDWGTSRMRLFRMAGGRIAERIEGEGIAALTVSPALALEAALAPWPAERRVVLCGMVGSSLGLAEVPYLDCPADLARWRGSATRIEVAGREVWIAAGLACTTPAGAPDVLRSEEAQIFGAMALDPALASGTHCLVLPGTHSKWVLVDEGAVVRFQTWFTGELFALLVAQSTLTRVGGEGDAENGFEAGRARARSGAGVIGALFEARTTQLRAGRGAAWAREFLSGLLIGTEVAEARAAFPPEAPLTLIGAPGLVERYRRVLGGVSAMDGDECVVAGLGLLEPARSAAA
jgi:2-dehydro-3-deoxygalactonokinase